MFESLIILISTTALLLGSPGPAPLSLAATGAAFGVKEGLPFLVGILLGLSVTILGASFGLATLFSQFPQVRFICQVFGAAYILYIAYKIAFAAVIIKQNAEIAPSLKDGFILNLLNPKAYAAFFAIFSQYLLPFSNLLTSYLVTGLVCLVIAAVVDTLWLAFGGILRPIFTKPTQARVIRIVFACLMVLAVIYSLF